LEAIVDENRLLRTIVLRTRRIVRAPPAHEAVDDVPEAAIRDLVPRLKDADVRVHAVLPLDVIAIAIVPTVLLLLLRAVVIVTGATPAMTAMNTIEALLRPTVTTRIEALLLPTETTLPRGMVTAPLRTITRSTAVDRGTDRHPTGATTVLLRTVMPPTTAAAAAGDLPDRPRPAADGDGAAATRDRPE
jgi:hypothetical protein